jgi:hypothetical protein
MSDWNDVLRISRASDQLLRAIAVQRPILRRHRILSHITLYDLRGKVDEIPGLGVTFTTKVGLAGGVVYVNDPNSFSHLIALPQFFRHDWNLRLVETHTLLHHELAHIILGHRESDVKGIKPYSLEYFNHPAELDAFMHQAVAGVVSYSEEGQFSWTSGPRPCEHFLPVNEDDFVAEVLNRYVKRALDALTPRNRAHLIERLQQMHWDAKTELLATTTPSASRRLEVG